MEVWELAISWSITTFLQTNECLSISITNSWSRSLPSVVSPGSCPPGHKPWSWSSDCRLWIAPGTLPVDYDLTGRLRPGSRPLLDQLHRPWCRPRPGALTQPLRCSVFLGGPWLAHRSALAWFSTLGRWGCPSSAALLRWGTWRTLCTQPLVLVQNTTFTQLLQNWPKTS